MIAAVTTPLTTVGEPDVERFIYWARRLLESGCDGLNVMGTTGEATSFTVSQRLVVMKAAARKLPVERLMVGTGAAAIGDAVRLTRAAAELGFAGALVIPPFYYKPVSLSEMMHVFEWLVEATASEPIPLYLYNFPALSGVAYTPEIVEALLGQFGPRIAGLKDSSGDLGYAQTIAGLSPSLDVFPSNESNLPKARDGGPFAGCISATANVNARDCAAAYRSGDTEAYNRALAIRRLFDGLPLVPSVKQVVAHLLDDDAYARVLPPFEALTREAGVALCGAYNRILQAVPRDLDALS